MKSEKCNLGVNQCNTPNMTLFKIGQSIENAMIAKDMTLTQLAQATNYSEDLIRSMIKGRRKAGLVAYEVVAEYLNIQFCMTIPIQEGRPKKEINS